MAKTKALISFAVTAKLICVLVFRICINPVFSRRGSYWPARTFLPLVITFNVGDLIILSDHRIIEFTLITSFDFSNTANEDEGDARAIHKFHKQMGQEFDI